MRSSTASTVHKASQPKFKAACDQCHANKVKCPGGGPPCQRCANSSQLCNYSLARRNGKPPGTKNRKTLERLAQTQQAIPVQIRTRPRGTNLGVSQDHTTGDSNSIECPDFSGAGAAPRSESYTGLSPASVPSQDRHATNSMHLSGMHNFWPLSPLVNSHNIGNSLNMIRPSEQELLGSNHDDYLDDFDQSILCSGDLELRNFGNPGRAATEQQNAEAADDYNSSSTPGSSQQNFPTPLDSNSPVPLLSQTAVPPKPEAAVSLDTVAMRLEESICPARYPFDQRQQTPCQCLPKYADVLCKLQTIERRQRPIQIDTLLTCTGLIAEITESGLKCTQCLNDSCVGVQLAMIFRTLFAWFRECLAQLAVQDSSDPRLCINLGQHQLAEDESHFVHTALTSRALKRTTGLLKRVMARVEHKDGDQRRSSSGKQACAQKGGELWNWTQLVHSLVQRFDALIDKFVA